MRAKGEIEERRREYVPKAAAYQSLKSHTGQDFGDDIDKWEAWIKANPQSIRVKKDVKDRLKKYLWLDRHPVCVMSSEYSSQSAKVVSMLSVFQRLTISAAEGE